jgi:UDP-N-acetylglucosamine 2-epimerase
MLCEKALLKSRPDLVLVYGDTNTTLAAALAAVKLGISVAHIEAGLRSGRHSMPEEINRKVTDHISSLLFYPTSNAGRNLRAEGIVRGLILSGDLMYELIDNYESTIAKMTKVVKEFGLSSHEYIMATLHRPENVDNPDSLSRIIDLLRNIDDPILFLMHPRTRNNLKRFRLLGRLSSIGNLINTEPQAYLQTLALIKWSKAVLTDSGGIQKEAGYLGRPCLTLRSETEWVETVERGANFLVGLSIPKMKKILQNLPRIRKGKNSLVKGRRPSEIITTAVVDYIRKKT